MPGGRKAADSTTAAAVTGLSRRAGHYGPQEARRPTKPGWRPSSNPPTTPSSARRSTAWSPLGTPPPAGCTGTPPPRRVGRSIRLVIPPDRLDEERPHTGAVAARRTGGALRDRTCRQERNPVGFPEDFADPLDARPAALSGFQGCAGRVRPASGPSCARAGNGSVSWPRPAASWPDCWTTRPRWPPSPAWRAGSPSCCAVDIRDEAGGIGCWGSPTATRPS